MQKRKSLILQASQKVKLQEETLTELKPSQVLVRSLLSAFKHGTEMSAYWGSSPFQNKQLDLKQRVFLDNDNNTFYPRPLGNMTVGVVEKIGSEVDSLLIGDTVFGWLPIADWHISSADKLQPLGELTPEQALCIDPACFALGGVLDGEIRYREKILITGLGAIGLLAVQYAKLYGTTIYTSSSFALRRQLALKYGAEIVLDRTQVPDLGLEIKQLTGTGVDAAIECSGSYAQLHQAIRATRQCGRVVCVGFYSGEATPLHLGEEFFHNRISLLASLPAYSWNNPVRGEFPLYAGDLQQLVIEDLKEKRLDVSDLLGPIYSFNQAEEAVEAIAQRPQEVLKVVIKYDS